ncbi:MAG: ribonuclease HII [Pseudomonadota bacterium]
MQNAPGYFDSHGVAGVDEAGRGPLAGPVVAAAVMLDVATVPDGLRDSKKLSEPRRVELAATIRRSALAWSVAWADRAEIDALNILGATMLSMRRAVLGLNRLPRRIVVDGNRLPGLDFYGRSIEGSAIVGGDDCIAAISAASILAKTTRDDIMRSRDRLYPAYAFGQHKGYGTRLHRERLEAHGPCTEHRLSFAPVRRAVRR